MSILDGYVAGLIADTLTDADIPQSMVLTRAVPPALPPRAGAVVIGVDLGGSASMTAAAFYWPETGRLECLGWFPSKPSLLHRGHWLSRAAFNGAGRRCRPGPFISRNVASVLGIFGGCGALLCDSP
jgi:hypothetical protein